MVTTVSVAGLAVLGTTVLGVSPANAAGATIYVNANGADAANCGSSVVQCKTIQVGVDKAQAGDTVLVAAGTYDGPVNITKGITVKSADGAATTIIDGADSTLTNGLVNIKQPGGSVTFTGFTVKNQTPSSNGDEFALTINDQSPADTITVSNNVFPGDGATVASSIGVNSSDTTATQKITGNEFSGLWEGILLEGSNGPVDVSNNDFHDLIPAEAPDDGTYPSKGIFFLGDKNVSATDQNVTDNKFRNYGGIGIDYRAGYDLGGCAGGVVCEGSLAGSVTGNTFDLAAPADTNSDLPSQQPAAISLQARYEGDELNLAVSGNTGTVKAPTQPILQVEGDGTVTITPGATPNKIVPDPAPTLDLPESTTILTDGTVKTVAATATNNSGEALTNARYDLTITGTKGIKASQLKLEYDADPTDEVDFQPVPLTGTATTGDAITGSFGPDAGFTFPSSATPLVTDFRLSVTDPSTPPDTLTTTVDLVQVSPGEGNPVINTLATGTSNTIVADAAVATSVDVASDAFAAQISATETTAVTATVKNVGGGVIAGQTVTFSVDLGFVSATATAASSTTVTAVTNASGVATAYVGSTLAGTQTITAKVGDVTGTATKTYYANATTLVLSPTTISFAAGTKQVFTATVTDVVGNPSPNTGVMFSNGDGPGLLNKANVITGDDGKASVTLTTATDDIGSGTVTATVFSFPSLSAMSSYTTTAPVPPTSVAGVTPTLGTLAQAGSSQTVTIKVVNGDNTAPPAGTEVNILVSGATVANGTVETDAAGNATFSFVTQHKGAFTVKAVAGGKSGSVSNVTPIRNVVTTIGLASPAKGTILALARTYPTQAGAVVAFYFVQNGKYVFFHNVATKADGTATITAPGRVSGGTYSMAARVVNNPDTDSVYSATKSIKLR